MGRGQRSRKSRQHMEALREATIQTGLLKALIRQMGGRAAVTGAELAEAIEGPDLAPVEGIGTGDRVRFMLRFVEEGET